MLAIRLQRIGRTDDAMYRLIVQESRRSPLSGRVVAYVGSYNPHTKEAKVQKDVAQKYLDNGAQPSPRVVKLLKDAGVKMPSWVKEFKNDNSKTTRNPEKLRKNRPAEAQEPVEEAPVEAPSEEEVIEVVEVPAETEEASSEAKSE